MLTALAKARAAARARGIDVAKVYLHPSVLADLRQEAEETVTVLTSSPPAADLTVLGITVLGDPRVPPGFIVPLRKGEDLDVVLARWLRALVGDVPAVDGTDLLA